MLYDDRIFISSAFLFITAVVLQFYYGRATLALCCMFVAAILIRIYFAHLDPFLHSWDEKFHALVARNMMTAPFTPMLKPAAIYTEVPDAWCCNHIWLHKQPLFLWQAALSMHIFGVSEVSLRYPSVLMGAIMTFFVYRITQIMLQDKDLAFLASALFCFSGFSLILTSGLQGMDHNDIAFCFYLLGSIWIYAEYIQKPSLKKVIFIGIMAGCAILNKWLTGLLVYSAWGIHLFLSLNGGDWKRELKHFALSIFVCFLVFLPWQFYIFYRFPERALFEYQYNSKHIFEAVEGHIGTNLFYLERFSLYFGPHASILIPIGAITILLFPNTNRKLYRSLIIYFLTVLGFFSLIAATKVESYFFVVVPIGFIFIASALTPLTKVKWKKHLFAILALVLAYNTFQSARLTKMFNPADGERVARIHNSRIYKNLYKILPDDINLVINVNEFEDVDIMFYNPGIAANHYWYSPERMEVFREKGIKIAAFRSRPGYQMPNYVMQYPDLFIIDVNLK